MDVQIKNCFRCRGLFVPPKSDPKIRYCKECLEKESNEFKLIKEYLSTYPNAGIEDISLETGVDKEILIQFLKEGKLEITSGNCVLNCEKCFEPIKFGRYCKECTTQLSKNLISIYNVKDDENAVASLLTKIQLRDK